MPPIAPHPTLARRMIAPIVLLAAVPLAGCGVPPELRQPPGPVAPATPGASRSAPAPVTPPIEMPGRPAPTPTGSDLIAVACRDKLPASRVVALLRGRARVLPRDVQVTVRTGPLCAGDWQYTVLGVTGHEELQAVTRGRADDLALVTAGTDVCTIEVRATGPAGIRTLACDGGPVA